MSSWRGQWQLYFTFDSFLTSALDGGEWSTSCQAALTKPPHPTDPLNARVGGPHSQSGLLQNTYLTLAGIRTPDSRTRSLDTSTMLSRLPLSNNGPHRPLVAPPCDYTVKQTVVLNDHIHTTHRYLPRDCLLSGGSRHKSATQNYALIVSSLDVIPSPRKRKQQVRLTRRYGAKTQNDIAIV
jgi:hypothetical protein